MKLSVNVRAVARMLGVVLLLLAVFLALPAAVGAIYEEWHAMWSCIYASLTAAGFGGLLAWRFRRAALRADGRPDYFRREGLATAGLAWLVGGVAGALPYLFEGTFTSFADAFFESVSGLTTTGSTVMSGAEIEAMPKAIAFWRSFSQWLGGFGIVMVFVVFFPTGGRSLFRSEVPGISREAGHQRVRDSALMLVQIYFALSIVLLACLMVVGMAPFDATIHTFTTIANGGFSNRADSIAHFDSAAIEGVLVVFMLLSAFNFAIYDTLFRVGPRPALRRLLGSLEARVFVSVVAGATLSIAAVLWVWDGPGLEGAEAYGSPVRALRDAVFQVTCIVTTAGYATADFDQWPQFCRVLLMVLAFSGACAGSTAGGLKIVRILIVVKAALVGVRRFARPRVIHQVRVDGQSLDGDVVASVTGYVVLWVLVFTAATTLVASFGSDLETSATAVLVTLNNVGPGLGGVGPYSDAAVTGFGSFHDAAKVALSLCMVLGRLEFYALVVLLMPSFWRR
ncbi:MAG: TrkH family potassium uptake protein [Planctomycetota bacterium]